MTRESASHAVSRLCCFLGVNLVIASGAFQAAAQPSQPPAAASGKAGSSAADSSKADATLNECLSAHRDSQQFRNQSNLVESHRLLQICGNDLCPAPVRRDCQRWVGEVAAKIPSVIFRLESSENLQSRIVRVFINGDMTFSVLPIRPVQFNPGTYKLRFVTDGKPELEQVLVLEEGEKIKEVSINFDLAEKKPAPVTAPPPAAAAPPPPQLTPLPPKPAPAVESRPVPVATYILGGLGVAATINFAAWGISSKTLVSDLQGRCSPGCPQDEVDSARLRATIADVSLGVGVASFTAATILYFLRPSELSPVNVDVGILPRGGWAASVRVRTF